MRGLITVFLILVAQLASTRSAHADPLLTPAFELQLEAWLGEGDLDFTNVYTRIAADDNLDFHAAADGQGRTFTLVEVVWLGNTYVIGGYNPQSWRTAPLAPPARRSSILRRPITSAPPSSTTSRPTCGRGSV